MVGGDHQRRQVVDFWRCTAFVLSYSLTATRNHINDFFFGGAQFQAGKSFSFLLAMDSILWLLDFMFAPA